MTHGGVLQYLGLTGAHDRDAENHSEGSMSGHSDMI